MRFSRRMILTAGGVLAATGGIYLWLNSNTAQARKYPFKLSEAEWKKRLPPEAYRILRQAETERAYTSPLNEEERQGTYKCAGCGQRVFASADKFDSGTGWPSFTRPIRGGVGTSTDYKLGYPRKEVHCANCGGHLGHVFDDGPMPTGKRWCINGLALKFVPRA